MPVPFSRERVEIVSHSPIYLLKYPDSSGIKFDPTPHHPLARGGGGGGEREARKVGGTGTGGGGGEG